MAVPIRRKNLAFGVTSALEASMSLGTENLQVNPVWTRFYLHSVEPLAQTAERGLISVQGDPSSR
jgi:hypothetical protein